MGLLLILGIATLCVLGNIALWVFGPQFFVYLLLFAGFIFFAVVDIPWDLVLQYGLIALGIVLLLTLLYHGWKRWLSLPRL
ncbi:hypothetical protein [Aquitalea pelogenes]|uniref:hypothetical protein n=1 Tax=Aquitalea pelogenes TaxID=1293573 RepID=UPI0035B29500